MGRKYQAHRTLAATRITPDQWHAARNALTEVVDRFGALVESADPQAMATADWTVMDTAAHVASVAWLNTSAVVSDDAPLPMPGIREHIAAATVDTIHTGLNPALLQAYPERDPDKVVSKLRASIDEILRATATADPARTLSWLGGARIPLAGLVAHLTNELLLHGRDIARAVDRPWHIPHEYAAQFFELFLVEIARSGAGHILDDDRRVHQGRIAVEFRSAYTSPVAMVLDTGNVWVEEPSRDNDVRVYFKPADLSLVLFHRVPRTQAALSGAVRVWGRRPWLLAPFLRKVRLP
ncbi:maleylpyruvate isomerase N-terminal domain-containing protein [Streptomyces sp. NPDC021562]|uniref:maleylpyruvate isomerase N-terminal domain-containing protein n=1 Tax=Streptomyces sp. NPDC021562 TaxID=3155121 RepID=UPI0033C9FC90